VILNNSPVGDNFEGVLGVGSGSSVDVHYTNFGILYRTEEYTGVLNKIGVSFNFDKHKFFEKYPEREGVATKIGFKISDSSDGTELDFKLEFYVKNLPIEFSFEKIDEEKSNKMTIFPTQSPLTLKYRRFSSHGNMNKLAPTTTNQPILKKYDFSLSNTYRTDKLHTNVD
jgi:hypothetical protein